mgnify:CR=1 FL=1
MSEPRNAPSAPRRLASRRDFLRFGSGAMAGAVCGAAMTPAVHAGEDNTIRLALIGCGGRGSGAAANAFESPHGPVRLVAMADFFDDRLAASHRILSGRFPEQVDVPPERRFVGFDSYRQAIDTLRPGDVAMLCGYAAWRPLQLEYAVARGVNVFMEKSFATDPPGVRRVLAAGEAAEKKNLKIAAGLMCRHSRARQQLIERIRNGELGEIQLIRAYRMEPVGPMGPKPPAMKELDWQIRNFTRFYWVSGGLFAEMDIHQIDEICWIKDSWPVSAHGVGGRAPRSADRSQNLDSFAVEWTFADGTKAIDVVRYLAGCHTEFATYAHGTRAAAQFSGAGHASTAFLAKDQRLSRDTIVWKADDEPCSIWQAEWNALLDAIRNDRPHNEAQRAALANLADIMGRAAVHMGRVVTWEEAMASEFQWFAGVDRIDENTAPPVEPDTEGFYPAPVPGIWKEL